MVTIIYNSYTIPNKYGAFSYTEDEKNLNVSLTFLVKSSSSGGLLSACQEAETKLTEINKDFSLSLSGGSEFSLSHSSNTGMLARPTLRKLDNELSTETSRAYSWSIKLELPMTQYGGRREGKYTISYDSVKRKTVQFSVIYTASGANSAQANYDLAVTGAKAWAAGILTALTGTYEIVNESTQLEQEGKIINGSFTYREIISDQSTAGRNDSNIVDSRVTMSVDYEQNIVKSAAGYTMPAKTHCSISYYCRFDKVETTESGAETIYQTKVKPLVIGKIYSLLGMSRYSQASNSFIVEGERKTFDPFEFSFSGTLNLLCLKGVNQILELDESVTISSQAGIINEKLWDGEEDTYNIWGIGGRKNVSRSISVAQCRQRPNVPNQYVPDNENAGLIAILQSRQKREIVREMGVGTPKISGSGGSTTSVTVYICTWSENYLLVKPKNFGNNAIVNLIAE